MEIAIIRLNGDGGEEGLYSSIIDPGTGPGPTEVHGLTAGDLAGAPRLAEIAGDITNLLDGAVIVAHNARHDTEVLSAEFARAGAAPDDLLSLCTLHMARRLGRPATSHRLIDCAHAEEIPVSRMHSAEGDARVCANLLQICLKRAEQQDLQWLDEIGAVGALPTITWAPWPITGRARRR